MLKIRHAIIGKTQYFDWAMSNSYLKLPESIIFHSIDGVINEQTYLCGPALPDMVM